MNEKIKCPFCGHEADEQYNERDGLYWFHCSNCYATSPACPTKDEAIRRASQKGDAVNHPSHYNRGKIECIDYIQDQQLNFCRGNAIKYIVRAGMKDPDKEIEDLKKAIFYIKQEISDIEKRQEAMGNDRDPDEHPAQVGGENPGPSEALGTSDN